MKKTASHVAAVRPPAVAGQFYPCDPVELRQLVAGFLHKVKVHAASAPKAIIVPHAGYRFSGPVAASAFARFTPDRDVIRRIVLIGPSHHVLFRGLAASSAEAFETPLGVVPVDKESVGRVISLPQVSLLDQAHTHEHSLEVQLPFLQLVLDQFQIVPLVAGEATDAEVAEIIAFLWGGPETRFVISSDLSHYLQYAEARAMDAATSHAIEMLRSEDITEPQACGRIPIRGLLRAALVHGLQAWTVDLRNSGDTAGPHNEVVGYGAFVFEEKIQSGKSG